MLQESSMEIWTASVFADLAAFAVEDVLGFALLDTVASRIVGGYMMVQHVIDRVLRQQTPADSTVVRVSCCSQLHLCGRRTSTV